MAQLAREHDSTIVILAESKIDTEEMMFEFTSADLIGFTCPFSPAGASSDFQIFSRLSDCEIQPVFDDPNTHVMIRRLVFAARPDLLLVVAHLQSKLRWTEEDQSQNAGRLEGPPS